MQSHEGGPVVFIVLIQVSQVKLSEQVEHLVRQTNKNKAIYHYIIIYYNY